MAEREADSLSLGETVADSTRIILEQNNRLGLGVLATLGSGEIKNMDEVVAALDLMGALANVSRTLLESRGGAIYKNGVCSQSAESGD